MNSAFVSSHLFYDALSGEFTPPIDPEQRTHTLARLAVAAFGRGERQTGGHTFPDKYRYSPSWAMGATAIAESMKSGVFVGLRLEGDRNNPASNRAANWAYFEKTRLRAPWSGPQLYIADSTGVEVVRPLQLGPELNDLRSEAAAIATGFFERVQDENQREATRQETLARLRESINFPRPQTD